MQEIKVNIELLEEKIGDLRTLRADCEAIDVSAAEVRGKGQLVKVLSGIDKEYGKLKTAIITLLDHSAGFFENVKQSVLEADEKSSGQ